MATTWIRSRRELAETLSTMTYSDLLEVARELYEMNADDNAGLRDMKSKYGMADTLSDWAEATLEQIIADELQAKREAA